MIIDFHTHIFPKKIAAHAIATIEIKAATPSYTDGSLDALRASMAESGVDISVLLSVATNPVKVSHMNDLQIAGAQQGDPDLVWFGCCHPHCPKWKEELERIAAAGLKGIKLHPQYQGFVIDSPESLRVLEKCGELGLMVVNHSGKEPAYPGVFNSSPEQIRNALKQVGPVTFVGAHMGALQDWDKAADMYGDLSNVYIDTSFGLRSLKPGERGYYTQEALGLMEAETFMKLVRDLGANRVVYGTDSPWRGQKQTIDGIRSLPLTDEEKEMIFHKNAEKLLGL
ncbi:MAG: metal-dependent hydrolase [Ruminococcaceae bacterium]|nr:metal-dependent hydrolase [Oscillospiraceae bacterium]